MKTKTSKKSSNLAYIITAGFNYGPFRTKSDAEVVRTRIASTNGVVTSAVKKGARGYTFASKTRIGAQTASDKTRAVSTIKKHAPSAKISIRKM